MTSAAIVTTLRGAGPSLESFISYHRAIGFSELFLFFDDPADRDLPRAAARSGVTAIPCDEALRERWPALACYPEQGPFTATEVMARQILNAELAIRLARERGIDWLLHIDADELFYCPERSAPAHFEAMSRAGWDAVRYLNYEAIPERDVGEDFFRDVSLFKVPRHPLAAKAMQVQAAQVPQLRGGFFHFYANGKSAARVSLPGLRPWGVHGFVEPDRIAVTVSPDHFILHYACCGFEAFWQKYVTLGSFGDRWWGTREIAPFHLEARDVVARGRSAARAFYRERIELADRARIAVLVDAGLAERIEGPRTLLEAWNADLVGTGTSRIHRSA